MNELQITLLFFDGWNNEGSLKSFWKLQKKEFLILCIQGLVFLSTLSIS